MNISKYKQAAEILYNSRKNKERINSLPLNLIPNNIEEGYLIQEQVIQLYLKKMMIHMYLVKKLDVQIMMHKNNLKYMNLFMAIYYQIIFLNQTQY